MSHTTQTWHLLLEKERMWYFTYINSTCWKCYYFMFLANPNILRGIVNFSETDLYVSVDDQSKDEMSSSETEEYVLMVKDSYSRRVLDLFCCQLWKKGDCV